MKNQDSKPDPAPFLPAGLMSFLVPGLGLFHNGQVLTGLSILVFAPVIYGLVLFPGFVLIDIAQQYDTFLFRSDWVSYPGVLFGLGLLLSLATVFHATSIDMSINRGSRAETSLSHIFKNKRTPRFQHSKTRAWLIGMLVLNSYFAALFILCGSISKWVCLVQIVWVAPLLLFAVRSTGWAFPGTAVYCLQVFSLALYAGYDAPRYLLGNFQQVAVSLSVAELKNHPQAFQVRFKDPVHVLTAENYLGRYRGEKVATRQGGGITYIGQYVLVAAPLVDADWQADQPVSAWVVEPGFDFAHESDETKPVLEHWTTPIQAGFVEQGPNQDYLRRAIRKAEANGLTSTPDVPIIRWREDPYQAMMARVYKLLFIAIAANLLYLLRVYVPTGLGRMAGQVKPVVSTRENS